jgi:hypothetical protein
MTASDHSQKTEDAPDRRPLILFLDQNKWIDLARAVKAPDEHRDDRSMLERLCAAVEAGEVSIPLTVSNLYETHKVNDFELRATIAHTQAVLSGGRVYRGRRRRLKVEAARVLAAIYERPWIEPDPDWVFSSLFFEASAEANDPALDDCISQPVLVSIAGNPQAEMFDYLLARDEAVRQQGLLMFEAGAERLRANIEERRARHRDQPVSVKRKIQGVLLFDGDQDTLISAADALDLPWRCFADNKGATMRRVVAEAPTLAAEREMVLKLEGQRRAIHVNDFCDMQNFTTVLPYADVVVAEKQFVNLARQAGMATRFRARMEIKLSRALLAGEMARCRVSGAL